MDTRSAASLEDPVGGVARLAEATGASFSHIEAARERTDAQIADAARSLGARMRTAGLSTCVFGSWARAELTDASDDDWAVLVNREFNPYDPVVLAEIVAAQAKLGVDDRKPGAQGVFGGPIAVPELIGNIGLDADTNTNLTRRLLLLLESRELHGAVRDDAIGAILNRYLNESVKDERPSRFLLNDVVRYWRTICVDFEGKAGPNDRKWATRNAKLRTSRKLLFAGGLVSVLLCLMSDAAARAELLGLTFETRESSALFHVIRDIGREFEAGLSALLFSTSLAPLTRAYAIF